MTAANIDQLIESVEQLETPELETYVAKVSLLLAKRRVPSLSSKELRQTTLPTVMQQLGITPPPIHG